MRGCLVMGAIVLVLVVAVCSSCGESETAITPTTGATTTTQALTATTRPPTTATTRPPTTTTTRPPTTGVSVAAVFEIEGSTSAQHGGLRFTVLGIEKFGQVVTLEGYEHTAKDTWLVVTLRVENASDGVPTYKSKDQTVISDGVAYRAESNMLGVDDSQWVTDDIASIPLFFDVPEAFPEDQALLTLNLVESGSDASTPGIIRVRASRRVAAAASTTTTGATTTTQATTTTAEATTTTNPPTTTTEATTTTQATTTTAEATTTTNPPTTTTEATTTTQATTTTTEAVDSDDGRYLTLLRRRAPRYDANYLFSIYSDDELVFLGRDFCSDLERGVSLEVLYGTPQENAYWVTEPTEVAVVSEAGLGIEYSTAIDVWCPEYRSAFDDFVNEIIDIVRRRG